MAQKISPERLAEIRRGASYRFNDAARQQIKDLLNHVDYLEVKIKLTREYEPDIENYDGRYRAGYMQALAVIRWRLNG